MRRFFAAALLALSFLPNVAEAQEAQSSPYSYLSAANNNSTLVYAGPTLLNSLIVVNTTNTIYYLKVYNKATAPVCGTDTPTLRIPIPQNNNGNGLVDLAVAGMRFPSGVGFCLTAGLADNDNTNAATGIALNFGLFQQ